MFVHGTLTAEIHAKLLPYHGKYHISKSYFTHLAHIECIQLVKWWIVLCSFVKRTTYWMEMVESNCFFFNAILSLWQRHINKFPFISTGDVRRYCYFLHWIYKKEHSHSLSHTHTQPRWQWLCETLIINVYIHLSWPEGITSKPPIPITVQLILTCILYIHTFVCNAFIETTSTRQ